MDKKRKDFSINMNGLFVSHTVEMKSLKFLLLMVLFQLTFSATKNSFWTKRSTFLTQQNQNRYEKIESEDLLRSFLKKSFRSSLKKKGVTPETEALALWFGIFDIYMKNRVLR